MEVGTDGSGDGIALPFPASLACDALFIERPCDSYRRHPMVFNLPGHVVNDVLFKPIRMRWKGLSETPSNRKKSLEGLCMGLFVRYPSKHQYSEGVRMGFLELAHA